MKEFIVLLSCNMVELSEYVMKKKIVEYETSMIIKHPSG
jgi:hypothetical protein